MGMVCRDCSRSGPQMHWERTKSKDFRFCRLCTVSVAMTQLCHYNRKTVGQDTRLAVFQQNFVMDAEVWFSYHFYVSQMTFLL